MKTIRRLLPTLSAVLCGATLLLLLADRIQPGLDLFLREPVKLCVLITCVVVIAASAVRLSAQRRRLRKRLARRKQGE